MTLATLFKIENKWKLLLVVVILSGCSKSKDAGPASPFANKTVVFIGDSITTGYGSTTVSTRWTTLFCSAEGCAENNMGVIGEVLQAGVVCTEHPVFDKTTIPAKGAGDAALFVALGMNDVGMVNGIMTPAAYQTTLTDLIDYAIATKGWSKTQIVIVSPTYTVAYNYFGGCGISGPFDETRLKAYVTAALAAATSKGCLSSNLYSAMAASTSPADLLSSDGLHPNDAGYAFIAGTLEKVNFGGL